MKEENNENVQHEIPRTTGNRPLEWDYWMTNLNIENSLRKIAELRGATAPVTDNAKQENSDSTTYS